MSSPALRSIWKRVSLTFLALSVFGAGCTKGLDQATLNATKKTTLTVWGVVDDDTPYQALFKAYRAAHPYVTIEYRRFRLEEYEDALLNGFATDRGPDVFLIHNDWVGKYQPLILPMPTKTSVAEQIVVGTVKKDVSYQLQSVPTVSVTQFKKDYPDTVSKDLIRVMDVSTVAGKQDFQQRVMGIPMSVDTLALFVNKDLLNAAGIAQAPETWDAFQGAVKKLTKVDKDGNIVQSGAAIGTAQTVERAPDIVSALMMQNGQEMVDDTNQPTFASIPEKLKDVRQEPPSYQALSFYTDFGIPTKEVYTWNDTLGNSVDAFASGKTAMMFGYSYMLPQVRAMAPKLNLQISKLPQIDGNPVVNVANYWAWTVSRKAKNPDIAWNFLNFLRSPDNNKAYLDIVKRPAALKSQLNAQFEDEDVGVFANQVLTAKTWYRGADPKIVDAVFGSMIQSVLKNGTEKIGDIVNNAQQLIYQSMALRAP